MLIQRVLVRRTILLGFEQPAAGLHSKANIGTDERVEESTERACEAERS